MALNNTYFETKGRDITIPIPDTPGYTPPSPPTPPTPGSGSTPVIPRPTFSGDASIQFYINRSDDDTLDKNIIASGTAVSVTIKDRIDLLDFYIPFTSSSYKDINYAYMLGRYYFCTPVIDAGNITGLHFTVDVLMTYNSQIKGLSAIVDRTGSQYNTYLHDSEVKITAYNNVHTLEATGGFSQSLNYYLLAIGM